MANNSKAGNDKHRILIIDDEENIVEIIKINLEIEGYEVLCAKRADEGIETAKSKMPDIVICDLMLPDLDGTSLCRALKGDSITNHIPIVVLSARAQVEDKIASIKAGADDFITKPFEFSDLIARVKINLMKSRYKLDINPLTGLPGGISVEADIKRRVVGDDKFSTLFIDIDNFSYFNKRFGFPKGDEIIKMLAEIIKEAVTAHENKNFFIGHTGGDDFVVIATPDVMIDICEDIIKSFESRKESYFSREENEASVFVYTDRMGVETEAPLITLSIGVATNLKRMISTHWEVAEIARETLKYAKMRKGSIYHIDRRLR